ncbi:PP2C family protein-serine/threonine phosphatase [Planctomycetota bacterium]
MGLTKIACHTDPGPRENLEDALATFEMRLPVGGALRGNIVCDGVGGHSYGEVASSTSVVTIASSLIASLGRARISPSDAVPPDDTVRDCLRRALQEANRAIVDAANERQDIRGMSTTVVCAVAVDSKLYAAWAGDSRCYLWREGTLERITRDHSRVQALIDAGFLDDEEAKFHPLSHSITRYLGQAEGFQADVEVRDLQHGDVILLCTDGLTDVLSDKELGDAIAPVVDETEAFDELPQRLVRQALEAGTTDNVTVICCKHLAPSEPGQSFLGQTRTDAYPRELARTFQPTC